MRSLKTNFLSVVALTALSAISFGQSDEAAAKNKEAEIEKAFTDYTKWWAEEFSETRIEIEKERLEERINELKESLELTDDQANSLEKAGQEAIKKSHNDWKVIGAQFVEKVWKQNQTKKTLEAIEAKKKMVAATSASQRVSTGKMVRVPYEERPLSLDIWKSAVKKTLNPEQLAIWEQKLSKEAEERKSNIETATKTYIAKQTGVASSQLEGPVRAIKKLFPLDEDREAALQKLIDETVDQSLKQTADSYRAEAGSLQDSELKLLAVGRFAIPASPVENPAESEIWKNGLAKFLTKGELANWNTERKNLEDKEKKEFEEVATVLIQNRAVAMRGVELKKMDLQVQDLMSTLDLPTEKKEELDALVEKSLTLFEEQWTEAAWKYLKSLPKSSSRAIISRNSFYMSTVEGIQPMEQDIWKEGIKDILTKDGLTRWETAKKERNDRRTYSFGNLIVMTVDEILGLSEAQRAELLPIASKIGYEKYLSRYEGRAMSLSTSSISGLFRGAEERDALAAFLEPNQEKRFSAWLGSYNTTSSRTYTRTSSSPEPVSDKDYKEEAVSMFLYDLMQRRRDDYVDYLSAKVESLDRMLNLTEEQKRYLIVAAKGSSQIEVEIALGTTAESIRRSVQNTTRANIYERLTQLSRTRVGLAIPPENEIWTSAVERILDSDQQSIYEEFLEAQNAFKTEAIVLYALSNAEISLRLSTDQTEILKPRLKSLLEKYESSIDKVFTSRNSWFLNSTYSMVLLSAVPDDEFKKILTAEQNQQWEKTFGRRVESYWTRIEAAYNEQKKKS